MRAIPLLASLALAGSLASLVLAACGESTTSGPDDAGAKIDGATPPAADATTDGALAPDALSPVDAAVRDAASTTDGADGSVQDATTADASDAADASPGPMVLTSGTLTDNGRFPAAHTCNGANSSPALAWTAGPPGTNSYAIVMKDLTVPNQHWTLYDIPSTALSLAAVVPNGYTPAAPAPVGSKHGSVTFSPATFGYLGPCPPRPGDHDYVLTVYALSGASLAGAAQADTPEVLEGKIKAQKVNAAAEASLRSKYKQP